MKTLSERALARRAGASVAHVRRLTDAGVLRPDERGHFQRADVQRIQIVAAYERGGIQLEDLARAVQDRRVTFEYSDRIYPNPSRASGRTIGDLAAALGPQAGRVLEIYTALGLPRPELDQQLTEAEDQVLPAFFEAWGAPEMSADAPLRAARLVGDAARRAAEGWTDLFMEAIDLAPDQRATMTVDVLGPRLFEPAVRVAQLLEPMVVWLLRRHMEQALNALNVETMERALELYGIRAATHGTPAIVFTDLSGFTRLTEEHGDQLAAQHASNLSQLAASTADAHSGRLVKQLGDGGDARLPTVGRRRPRRRRSASPRASSWIAAPPYRRQRRGCHRAGRRLLRANGQSRCAHLCHCGTRRNTRQSADRS
jgi:adenylate cyclase